MIARAPVIALSVALALAPAVALASTSSGPVKGAHYKGASGPGYPLTFQISGNGKQVTHLVVAFEETCNGSAGDVPPKFDFPTLTISHGKFHGSSTDHFGKKVSQGLHIKGHFSGRKATGTVSDTSKIKSLPTCTETTPFSAKVK
jgi:hypothetical protein